MRKIIITAFVILFAALIVIFKIQNEQITDATANTTKIGVLLSGSRSDQNYCQTHYEAIEAIRSKLNLNVVYRENVDSNCEKVLEQLIKNENCQLIVSTSFNFCEDVKKAAEQYPDIYFLQMSGNTYRHNLTSFVGRMYQARYLSGIVAGQKTKTGHIGYVASLPIPEVIQGINAFMLGVKSVNQNACLHVSFANSWTDDKQAKAATELILDRYPIDILTMQTDSNEPCRLADKRGVLIIGSNRDNSAMYPDTYLTACIWKWENYYSHQILSFLQKKFNPSVEFMDLEDDMVGLSPFTPHVSPETRKQVDNAIKKLQSWKFDVFYGPIQDNHGILRVDSDESMSDDEMWNKFNWYVEGVIVEETGPGGA
ncbi:MAG: BMP family ABC transporter substrate-binding protein [Succinivibrio sp.]|nr:BMP family ABC transporter substrate-binding protein [Succinivibrio sp.]